MLEEPKGFESKRIVVEAEKVGKGSLFSFDKEMAKRVGYDPLKLAMEPCCVLGHVIHAELGGLPHLVDEHDKPLFCVPYPDDITVYRLKSTAEVQPESFARLAALVELGADSRLIGLNDGGERHSDVLTDQALKHLHDAAAPVYDLQFTRGGKPVKLDA